MSVALHEDVSTFFHFRGIKSKKKLSLRVLWYQTVRIVDEVQTSYELAKMLRYRCVVCLGACQRPNSQWTDKNKYINRTQTNINDSEATAPSRTHTHTYTHIHEKTQAFSRCLSVLFCPVHIQRTAAVKLQHCVALQGKWRRWGHTLGCGWLYTPHIKIINKSHEAIMGEANIYKTKSINLHDCSELQFRTLKL